MSSKELMMKSVHTLLVIVLSCVLLGTSCQQDPDPEPEPVPSEPSKPTVVLDTIYRPVDPAVAPSIGFFRSVFVRTVRFSPDRRAATPGNGRTSLPDEIFAG